MSVLRALDLSMRRMLSPAAVHRTHETQYEGLGDGVRENTVGTAQCAYCGLWPVSLDHSD